MVRGTQVSTETRAAPNEACNAPGTAHIHVISFNPHNLRYRSHHIHFQMRKMREDKTKESTNWWSKTIQMPSLPANVTKAPEWQGLALWIQGLQHSENKVHHEFLITQRETTPWNFILSLTFKVTLFSLKR